MDGAYFRLKDVLVKLFSKSFERTPPFWKKAAPRNFCHSLPTGIPRATGALHGLPYFGEKMVPGEGFEPPAFGLQNRCTTTVLTRHDNEQRPAIWTIHRTCPPFCRNAPHGQAGIPPFNARPSGVPIRHGYGHVQHGSGYRKPCRLPAVPQEPCAPVRHGAQDARHGARCRRRGFHSPP
ncbi:hypothetical protein MSKU9_2584 [Komagataeibacter diospyri]|uniref:Uncharacterized protein n=1 Tax=Komagataeibacter diospyri TaxID=1932662 RepID=A0A4P5NSD8_9PROT|nr:hypothetical protein MSKU9_2584 [Komagataeibacter diospyri]